MGSTLVVFRIQRTPKVDGVKMYDFHVHPCIHVDLTSDSLPNFGLRHPSKRPSKRPEDDLGVLAAADAQAAVGELQAATSLSGSSRGVAEKISQIIPCHGIVGGSGDSS